MALPRPLVLAALAALLLSAAAGASVFAWLPVSVDSLYSAPPVILLNLSVEDEALSSSLGANATSAHLLIKASAAPDSVCNGNISVAAAAGSYILPLCWLPYGLRDLEPGVSNVSFDAGTLSALLYNETGGVVFSEPQVFRGLWVQSFLYPGAGVNSTAEFSISFSYNATITSLLGTSDLVIYAVLLNSTGYVVGYGSVGGIADGNWHVVTFTYSPESLGMTGPGFYYLLIGFDLTVYPIYFPLLGYIGYLDSVYIHLDTVSHRMPMQQGLLGFYATWPALYMVNDTVAGWVANISINRGEGVTEALAWYMNPFGLVGSSSPVHYEQALDAPVEGASANLTSDLLGLGILVVYGYGAAQSGGLSLLLSYSNNAVKVGYPVMLDYQDPPGLGSGAAASSAVIKPVSRPLTLAEWLARLGLGIGVQGSPAPFLGPGAGSHHRLWLRVSLLDAR